MSSPFGDQAVPRGALLGVAGLIGFALLAVSVAQWTGHKSGDWESGPVADSRDLRFEDGVGGTVYVFESSSDTVLATLDPGSENFVRGVLRALARERRSQDLDVNIPIRITRYQSGRLILEDRATGRLIDLQAFGPTNAQSFARLLDAEPAGSSLRSHRSGTTNLGELSERVRMTERRAASMDARLPDLGTG